MPSAHISSKCTQPKFDTCFFERYAAASLHALLGNRYASLINYDRPDLQDNSQSIGIEVTRAMSETKNAEFDLVNAVIGSDRQSADDTALAQRNGYSYGLIDDNRIGSKERDYWNLALPLKRILTSKIYKASNGFYGYYDELGLYVFSKEKLNLSQIQDVVKFINIQQNKGEQKYSNFYYSQVDMLYSCNMNNKKIQEYNISLQMRQSFYHTAMNTVNP